MQEITTGVLLHSPLVSLGRGGACYAGEIVTTIPKMRMGSPVLFSTFIAVTALTEAQRLAPHKPVVRHKEVPISILPATGLVPLLQPSHRQSRGLLQHVSECRLCLQRPSGSALM